MVAVSDVNIHISGLKNLPELPAASINIIDAVSDPDVSVEELAKVISISPVLVARLLGLANSAYFGCAYPITDIKTAIIRVLGLNLVKSLSLGILLNLALNTSKCGHFRCEKLWLNALMTATISQKFSLTLQDKDLIPTVSYTAGLLLNIGLVAAVHLFPEQTDQVLLNAERNHSSVSKEMADLIGYDQYEIGSLLLAHWHLPEFYQLVLKEFKNTSYTGAEVKFIAFISLCFQLAKKILAEQCEELTPLIAQLQAFGLSEAVARPIISEVLAKKENIYLAALAVSGK